MSSSSKAAEGCGDAPAAARADGPAGPPAADPLSPERGPAHLAAGAGAVGSKAFIAVVIAHALADGLGGIWPVYKKLAGLDLAKAGLIATIVNMLGTLTQPFFGLWADRTNRRPFIVLGTLLTFSAMLLGPLTPLWPRLDAALPGLLGFAGSYLVMFVIMMAVRLGQDMFHPVAAGLAGSFSDRHRSTYVAVFIAVGSMGFGLSQPMFSKAYALFAGHTEYVLAPAFGLWLLVVGWCRTPRSAGGEGMTVLDALRGLRSAGRYLLVLFLILVINSAVNGGLFFILPEFVSQRGYPDWLANGWAFYFFVLGSTLMMVPAGRLADRIGRRVTLIVCAGLSAVTYHALVRLPHMPIPAFIAVCIVAGGFLGTVNPLGVAFGQHLAPRRNVGMVSAIMMGLAWCLGNVSPSLVGYHAKRTSPATALLWLGACNVVMFALGFLLPGRRAENNRVQ